MTVPEVPRAGLVDALLARTREGAPLLLAGPPGAGKTTLLLGVAEALRREGWVAVYLDMMGAASSPDRFVASALDALPAACFGRRLAQATEIRRLAAAGRAHGAAAVQGLFALWSGLDDAGGRPVALLLDEATEIRSLAYFAGLRTVDKPFAAALAARRRGTLLATSFPTLAAKLWSLDTIEARPFTAAEIAAAASARGIPLDAASVARASFGWPRHVRILIEGLAEGGDVAAVWAREMAPGGRLELGCRHTYESLLLRSRGYGMSKAVLAAVAQEEGLNLTALVARIGRTPGAVRDYLQWLVGVDALRMIRKRYHYVDGVVRQWVRLHTRGGPPSEDELRAAGHEAAGAASAPDTPLLRVRRESLMEID
jgi:hypothetical protein